ncbi:hypothetical protein [Candidatus Aciduliprofundum boonei]|uniref:Uncharacterized protein n=1 Tax=Aciduliprofundum boonei (strain DSM 19572 / T469) TaxID=439481 RepID=B5IH94_ACIB4|nr:hypothetical protein [Candidatus Aciduliprofundum boonei]ADD08868.1 hypothetical protein Aboo_1059 [Aciduliprofundum boonei T469]EDY34354.1 hypothetical protein ABOONEI_983 [Aciduliprofundum boonei T469]HII55621.1 hypothetical protein [Candidatus Aciduliprofundum boonei]
MRIVWEKEEGLFGVDSAVWWGIAIAVSAALTFFAMFLNYQIADMAWKGFLYLMRPSELFPNLLNLPNYKDVSTTGIHGMMSAAIYLNGVIVEKIVNALIVFMLWIVGLMYLYADLFESFFGRLKSIIPRLIIALILAYGSIYVVNYLIMMGKYAYMVLYNINIGALGAWKEPTFYNYIKSQLQPPTTAFLVSTLEQLLLKYIWSFLSVDFTLMLLMVVVVRDVLFAVLIVLLPIAAVLLLTPWTTSIGERLWFLAVDLVFLPFVMIIPLMLVGPVANHITFVIAGMVISVGAIYLLAKEPFILSGIGFGRAGEHLSRGLTVGAGLMNMIAIKGAERATITGGSGGGAVGAVALKGSLGQAAGKYAAAGTHGFAIGHRAFNQTHGNTLGGATAGAVGTGAYLIGRTAYHAYDYLRRRNNGGGG